MGNFAEEKGRDRMKLTDFFLALKKRVDQQVQSIHASRHLLQMDKPLSDKQRQSEEYLKMLLDSLPADGSKKH